MTKIIMALLLCGVFFGSEVAALSKPLVFRREKIVIQPAASVETPEEGEASAREPIELLADIRPEDALRAEGIQALNRLSGNRAVLVLLDESRYMPLPQVTSAYQALDVLLVDENGGIRQIFPQLHLATLQQDIFSNAPIKAWLFLPAGEVKKGGVLPGDQLIHSLFVPAVQMME